MAKQKTKRPAKSKKPLPGITLEKIVARIQQMMDPASVVTHNEKLEDRVGNIRQYDVVIRGKFGGRDILGIIECKDHKYKKGPSDVEAFSKKCENVGAHIRIMVSKKGFTPQALKLAKHEHIDCFSLLPESPTEIGLTVGVVMYAKLFSWTALHGTLNWDVEDGVPPPGEFGLEDILFQGKPVQRWFERQLDTDHGNSNEVGDHFITLTFKTPQVIEIQGTSRKINSITVTATRAVQGKRRWLRLQGDGFFDWHAMKGTIPPGGNVISEPILPWLIAEWDDFDGDIDAILESRKQYFTVCFHAVLEQFELDPDTPDLAALSEAVVASRGTLTA